jgi:flagellar biosynthesis protein FlhG
MDKGPQSIPTEQPLIVSVASGKGGVGKTFVTANLAACLAGQGKKVLVVDCDLGLANMDILLGITPEYTLQDVVFGNRSANEVVIRTDAGFDLVPASSGVKEMGQLAYEKIEGIKNLLNRIIAPYDLVFLDTGAGISEVVLQFNLYAQKNVIVLNKEPTSVTDAYAVMKVMSQRFARDVFGVIVNSIDNANQGEKLFGHINRVSLDFLDLPLHYLGHIVQDDAVAQSIVRQEVLAIGNPHLEVIKNCAVVANALLQW